MSTIEVNTITKSFGSQKVVDSVSFEVDNGEIFGLLGPNGAGKTTTIRILLDIFKPDSGSVSILGGAMTEQKKEQIGYLPEERGLYQDIPLDRCLVYLATLKGVSRAEAKSRVASWLDKFDLSAHSNKKVKELSKGMQQKAQLISALLHEPQIVIIDEPFSALDPVNTQMVKDILMELRKQNRTVVMCTHQMHQVEELCDRLVLIDHGKIMLYGSLGEIQNTYTGSDIILKSESDLSSIGDIRIIEKLNGNIFKIALPDNTNPQQFLRQLVQQNVDIEQFEVAVPTLDEIFIKVVKQGSNDKAER
jgi:ABC-2 type transport system ATP-binding protein